MAELGFFVVSPSSSDRELGQRFILIVDICVQNADLSRTKNKIKKQTRTNSSQHLKGTLVREVLYQGEISGIDSKKILCKDAEFGSYFQCYHHELKEITEDVYNLLLAIPNCKDRYEIVQNEIRLAEGLEMDIGNAVLVKVPNTSGDVEGTIRFKGLVFQKEGTFFGVELWNADGRGNTNGSHGKARYFECDEDCGVFLPLSRVRPLRTQTRSQYPLPRKSKQSKMSASKRESIRNTLYITPEEMKNIGISHDMEVFIFTEVNGRESQEKGKVKFIGRLTDNRKSEIFVGIDLAKPVGNGTGLYNGKHLFYTKQNHAALVPLSGVLPAYFSEIQTTSSNRNHVYQEVESITPPYEERPRTHKEHNGLHRRAYHTEELPKLNHVHDKRNVHTSPGTLDGTSARRSRLEDSYEYSTNQRQKSLFKPSKHRHSPMDVEYSNPREDRETSRNYFPGTAHKLSHESQGSRHSNRGSRYSHLNRENSGDNNSDDDDLYGSEESIVNRRPAGQMDLYKENLSPLFAANSSPTRLNVLRPTATKSCPEIPNRKPRYPPNRSVKTVPLLHPHPRNNFDDNPSSPMAQIVDFNSISEEVASSSRDNAEMEVGSMVEVTEGVGGTDITPNYGVIRWIGELQGHKETVAGIEFDSLVMDGTDGTFRGKRYFACQFGRGRFVLLKFCKKDARFMMPEINLPMNEAYMDMNGPSDFGDFDAPRILGSVSPPKNLQEEMIGKRRGIQGHHNSCYLDSTLFSLFAYSKVLDTLLFREKMPGDLPEYEETQKVLRELIINPLRQNNFVRADRIMQLRELLDQLGSVSGLVSEEKDPEEFLNTLLVQVFKAEPLIEIRQGDSNAAHEAYFYQIFMEKDEKMGIPSTQQLLERSFISADLKFRHVPVCLILQMPRFGKDYKMYKRLQPSLTLDITNLVEDMPRNCDICEGVAEYECRDCYLEKSLNEAVFSYCKDCAKKTHSHRKRSNHCYKAIKLPDEFRDCVEESLRNNESVLVERQELELFAVVCIATSHYVSFTKCGTGKNSTWCFFDSMADRVGEQSGYNIPEVRHCPEVEAWLQWDEEKINEIDEKSMPELMRRLLCDAYMCMYQSVDMMYNK